MKKFILFMAVMLSFASLAEAQQDTIVRDTIWRKGGLLSLNFTQVSLTNWAAGGENSISGNAIVNYYANYKRGKDAWDNTFDLGYGMLKQGKDDARKTDDKI